MRITDQRIIEAANGTGLVLENATPMEALRAYAQWTLNDPMWADVILAVAEGAGMKINTKPTLKLEVK